MIIRPVFCILILLAGNAITALSADNVSWSAFRGPDYGIAAWTNAPVAWDGETGDGVLWKTKLQMPGVSSPSLWGDTVYITESNDRERAVLAFDAGTGRQLWRQVVTDGGKAAGVSGDNPALPGVSDAGLALPTPTCDADGVYAVFGTGDVAAFTYDGKLKWQHFLQRPVIGYGFSSSPCVKNHLLFIQFDTYQNGRVYAFDTATGKVQWEHERSRGGSWSSPIIIPNDDGKPLFVVNANGSLTAFDETGNIVWDIDGVTGQVTPTPAYSKGQLFPVNVGSSLLCYKTASGPVQQCCNKIAPEPVKQWQFTGHLSDTGSPVALNGLLFMGTRDGELTCVDTVTGKGLWVQKAPASYASLVASGDRVYLLGRAGTMLIFAAERDYRAIATCQIPDGTDSTPAFSNGRIYIRGRNYLWCIGAK